MAQHEHSHSHNHGHNHAHVDFAQMIPALESQAELAEPMYRDILDWVRVRRPEPGLIVDAGSGPGVISGQLAAAFPGARIVAADSEPALLERARSRAERLGFADRFSTLEADLAHGLGELEYPADLLWSSLALHHVGNQRAALTACAAALAPGGTIALVEGGLPPRRLPRDIGIGRPGLQARMDAVEANWFAEMRTALPGHVGEVEDWAALLTAAGLRPTGTRTFLLDLPAPVSDEARSVVIARFTRAREVYAEHLDAPDRATLDRLLDPNDKASLHHRPDVFVLEAYTVHTAVKDTDATTAV